MMFENLKTIVKNYEYNFIIKLWCGGALIFGIMCVVVSATAEHTLKQLIYTSREHYDYIFFTAHSYHTNSFYYVGNSLELRTNKGLKLQGEVLMQSDEATYNERGFRRYEKELSEYEIAVSRNMATKNGLKIGDSFTATYPAFSEEMQVVIVGFFDDTFGLVRNHFGNGVVVVGYNPLIAKNTNVFTSFVSDETTASSDFVYFTQNQKRIDVKEDITALWLKTATSVIIPLILLCSLQLFICYFFTAINCSSYYHRHLLLGRNISSIKSEIKIDCYMVCLPIALIALLFNSIVVRVSLGYAFSCFAIALFVLQWLSVILSCKIILRKIIK